MRSGDNYPFTSPYATGKKLTNNHRTHAPGILKPIPTSSLFKTTQKRLATVCMSGPFESLLAEWPGHMTAAAAATEGETQHEATLSHSPSHSIACTGITTGGQTHFWRAPRWKSCFSWPLWLWPVLSSCLGRCNRGWGLCCQWLSGIDCAGTEAGCHLRSFWQKWWNVMLGIDDYPIVYNGSSKNYRFIEALVVKWLNIQYPSSGW